MRVSPAALIAAAAVGAALLGVIVGSGALSGLGPAAASPTPAPTPTASPTPSGPKAQVYVVAEGRPPLRVESSFPLVAGTLLTRISSRMDGLRATVPPEGYVNPYSTSTVRLERITHDEPNVISLWFFVREGDWGVPADQAKLLLQQLVWTATEEPGIEIIRIWQNQGLSGANISGVPANYEMMRKTFP